MNPSYRRPSRGRLFRKLPRDVDWMRHRIFGIWTIFLIAVAVLTGRLFLATMHPDKSGLKIRWQDQVRVKAEMEHLGGEVTDDARGRILFRNGEALSGQVRHARLTTRNGWIPYSIHTERTLTGQFAPPESGVAIAGEVGLPDVWPTPDRVVAEQGRSGLEASFDSLLRGHRPGYIGVLRSATGETEDSAVFQVKPKPGPDLRTTLDPAWQEVANLSLQKEATVKLGAVTILDVNKNEALAMANRSGNGMWDLPAVKSAIPGSIMKLVTAAAAFDSYRFRPSAKFDCNGVSQLDGVKMHCWTVHGAETFTEAIARSCDIALAVVGSEVRREGLEAMWNRLHLTEPNLQSVDGQPVLREAEGGVLFRRSGNDNGLLANTAIGQEDVRISPLQAANLAATIASGGIYRNVDLVLDAQVNHKPVRHFARTSETRAFSLFTAQKLAEAMSLAVEDPYGTAHDLASFHLSLAVKTGTAELPDGRVNGWMIGFLPVDKPQIAFSVYVGDLPESEAHVAVHRIATDIILAYRQFQPQGHIG